MLTFIAGIGVLIVLACAWAFADLSALINMMRKFSGSGGYAFAIGVRVMLGVAAWLGAPDSLLPIFLQVLIGFTLAWLINRKFKGKTFGPR